MITSSIQNLETFSQGFIAIRTGGSMASVSLSWPLSGPTGLVGVVVNRTWTDIPRAHLEDLKACVDAALGVSK